MRREVRATANRLANFDDANLRRSARAAVAAGARVQRALEILGDEAPEHLLAAGRLRMEHAQASLEELGALADPPLTKDAIAGRIRRLLALADKRAEDLGVPGTEANLTPEMLASTRSRRTVLPMTITATGTLRAAIYTRVSSDKSGEGRSPAEQEAEARRDCERQGWQVAGVYTDNDRGASRWSKRTRPEFARLLDDLDRGAVDVVATWEASRLSRDTEVYADLAGRCRAAGVLLSYNGRTFDLDDPDAKFSVGLDALLAQREAGVTRKRVRRALAANATAGKVHGRMQFGYRRVYDDRTVEACRQEPDPEDRPRGHGVVPTGRRGGVAAEARRRARRPRRADDQRCAVDRRPGGPPTQAESYLGRRTHHGLVTVADAWPALVDETTWHRVQAVRSKRTASETADPLGRSIC